MRPTRCERFSAEFGILEHHLDGLSGLPRFHLLGLEDYAAPWIGPFEAEQNAGDGRLAAARLANETQGFARPDIEGHVAERMN